jgi:hypothetical protein
MRGDRNTNFPALKPLSRGKKWLWDQRREWDSKRR